MGIALLQACAPKYVRLEREGDLYARIARSKAEDPDACKYMCEAHYWGEAADTYARAVEHWPERRGDVDSGLTTKLADARRDKTIADARESSASFSIAVEGWLRTDDLVDPYTSLERLESYAGSRAFHVVNHSMARPDALDKRFLARLDAEQRIWEQMALRPDVPGLTLAGLAQCESLAASAAEGMPDDDPLVRDIRRRCGEVRTIATTTIRAGIDDPDRGLMARAARWRLLGLLAETDAYADEYEAAVEAARLRYAPRLDVALSGNENCPLGAEELAQEFGASPAGGGDPIQASLSFTQCGLFYSFESRDVVHTKTTTTEEEVTEYTVVGYTYEQKCVPGFEQYYYGNQGSTAWVNTVPSCSTVSSPVYEAYTVVKPVERVHTWTTTTDVYDYMYRLNGTLTVGATSTPFEASDGHLFEMTPGEEPVVDEAALRRGAVENAAQELERVAAYGFWTGQEALLKPASRTDLRAFEEYCALIEIQGVYPTADRSCVRIVGYHQSWPMWQPPGDASRESAEVVIGLVDPAVRAKMGLLLDFRPM